MKSAGNSDRAFRTTVDRGLQGSWNRSGEKSLAPGAALDNSLDQTMKMEQIKPGDPSCSSQASKIDMLETEIEDLEAQLQAERLAKEALHCEVDKSSDEIKRLVQEHEARLNEVKSSLLGRQKALDNVTHELATAKENLKEKENALDEVEQDLFLSKQEVRGLQDKLEDQEAQSIENVKEYEGKLQNVEQRLLGVERQRQESAAQLSAIQGQMNARIAVGKSCFR
jgi:predicted  nucleic acid-binding Zn-ribbon protein